MVSPLLMHWRYCNLALSHQFVNWIPRPSAGYHKIQPITNIQICKPLKNHTRNYKILTNKVWSCTVMTLLSWTSYHLYIKIHFTPNKNLMIFKILSTIWLEKVNLKRIHKSNQSRHLGAVSIRKTVLPGMAIPMLKIRPPNGRLIFNIEIAIRR